MIEKFRMVNKINVEEFDECRDVMNKTKVKLKE